MARRPVAYTCTGAVVASGCSFVHALRRPSTSCSTVEADNGVGEHGKTAAMKRWIRRKGVAVADVPRVITTFYIAKNLVFVASLGLCIKFQPLRRLFQSGRPQRLKLAFIAKFPNFYAKSREKILSGAERLAASRLFRPLPEALGTKPKAFALGLAENMVLFKLTFPIHAPLTLLCVINFYAQPASAAGIDQAEATTPVGSHAVSSANEFDERTDRSLLSSLLRLEDVTNAVHDAASHSGH